MNFPKWVDQPRSKKARATNRLKYLLTILAANATGRQSMRALAEKVGLDHSTLSGHIRKGSFPKKSATLIELKIGRDTIKHEDLMDPLSISQTG